MHNWRLKENKEHPFPMAVKLYLCHILKKVDINMAVFLGNDLQFVNYQPSFF